MGSSLKLEKEDGAASLCGSLGTFVCSGSHIHWERKPPEKRRDASSEQQMRSASDHLHAALLLWAWQWSPKPPTHSRV